MKHTKLIGLAIMSSAILLQVGYAATQGQEHPIVNTKGFDVYFENPVTTHTSEAITIEVSEQENNLNIQVSNLYPGAEFGVETHIKNNGDITARIKSISLKSKESDKVTALMDMLVGYDDAGKAYIGEEAYNAYLKKVYQGYELNKGATMPLKFKLGMVAAIENLQNEQVEFTIQLDLEQVISSGGGSTEGGGNDGDNEIQEPETQEPDTTKPETTLPKEVIPGGEATLPEIIVPDETVPGGEATDLDIDIKDEPLPGGAIGDMLPKTGGVTPTIVYTIGFAMLAGGLMVYKKKE